MQKVDPQTRSVIVSELVRVGAEPILRALEEALAERATNGNQRGDFKAGSSYRQQALAIARAMAAIETSGANV